MADPHRDRSHRIPHGLTAAGLASGASPRSLTAGPAPVHDRALGPGSRGPPGPGGTRGAAWTTTASEPVLSSLVTT
jgi:hypothetical protein